MMLQGAAFAFFHDMAVTEHYYILFQNPTTLDFRKLLTEYMFAKVLPIELQQGSRLSTAAKVLTSLCSSRQMALSAVGICLS